MIKCNWHTRSTVYTFLRVQKEDQSSINYTSRRFWNTTVTQLVAVHVREQIPKVETVGYGIHLAMRGNLGIQTSVILVIQ